MIDPMFEKSELCKSCAHTKVCMKDKNVCGDVFVAGNPMIFDNNELWKKYKDREAKGFPCDDYQKEIVRCKDCVHHKNAPKTTDVWCERLDGLLPKDWFCADGERGGTDV